MNNELKEKMQQAADEFAKADTENWQEYERYLVGSIQVKAFRSGAAAMYAELAPLVEWGERARNYLEQLLKNNQA